MAHSHSPTSLSCDSSSSHKLNQVRQSQKLDGKTSKEPRGASAEKGDVDSVGDTLFTVQTPDNGLALQRCFSVF